MTRGTLQLTLIVVIVAGLTAIPATGVGIGTNGDAEVNDAGNGNAKMASSNALQTCNYTDVYRDAIDGVVLVQTQGGLGSGFVWQAENDTSYVVTNEHVVGDNATVLVRFSQGETVRGEVAGTDRLSDLAVVRVAETPDYVETLNLSERTATPGEAVAAIGSPFGLERTITQGIVSGVNRTTPTETGFPIPLSIQTDAAINPGNSGGPLVACDGTVLGVNRAGGGNDIGFAISAELVREVAPALREDGEYAHSYLGIRTAPLDPAIVGANDLNVTSGVYVVEVVDGGPADGVLQGATDVTTVEGVRVPVGGDVIVEMGERSIETEDDLVAYLTTEADPGETIEVTVIRDGERQTVNVTVGERPEPPQA